MNNILQDFTRRRFLGLLGGAAALGYTTPITAWAGNLPSSAQPVLKTIPSSGETIPAIGMGTWITFNVGDDPDLLDHRTEILKIFFDRGGSVIDCSPMYGSAASALGYGLNKLNISEDELFAASKVWTWRTSAGPDQMAEQKEAWDIETFDLMQVHNLQSWEGHLKTLREDKEQGKIRYLGVTTSHGRRHDELEKIMESEPLDFVQLTYNIDHREAENRLLPLARDKGIAVIANRPFDGGGLFSKYTNNPLPGYAAEIGCNNWAQFFLKFIISHPAITCAVPATSQKEHMRENMGALYGELPDDTMRRKMIQTIENI